MKKIIILFSAIFFSMGAFAQEGFQWGVKAGLNLATLSNASDAKFRPGLHAGVFGEYVINDFVGVQAELLYSMQGAKANEGGISATMKYDYINLPILAKLYVLEGLSIDLGPQFGYMVSAKAKGSAEGVSAEVSVYDEMDNKFDVSFAVGASYKLPFNIDVFARYNLGLTKVLQEESEKFKNSVIQIGVGYRF